jgi:hypothetical protein
MPNPVCPLCDQPVDICTEAHITEANGEVRHHECPVETPPEPEPAPE